MKFPVCIWSLALMTTCSLASFSRAAVILTVSESAAFDPGANNVTINVFARTFNGTQLVSGFSIPLDITPPTGFGLPTGISRNTNFLTNPVFTFQDPNTAAGQNGRILVNNNLNPISGTDFLFSGDAGFDSNESEQQTILLNDVDRLLFTLNFTFDDSVMGRYPVNFVTGPNAPELSVVDGDFNSINIMQVNNGALNSTAAAVPEPSLLLFTAVAVGVGGYRLRRRHLVGKAA